MPKTDAGNQANAADEPTRSDELRTFLLLTVVLAPVLAVVCVGGYGFIIWMWQLVFGPPGA